MVIFFGGRSGRLGARLPVWLGWYAEEPSYGGAWHLMGSRRDNERGYVFLLGQGRESAKTPIPTPLPCEPRRIRTDTAQPR
ncbi:MAG: hypothetical protein Ct9H300mP15_22320 [Gemmatimonadota bacterium]|nr:MAG: hypothetical protein Ct9H300mP15_22320 [Gemmatimonadota bacterium]